MMHGYRGAQGEGRGQGGGDGVPEGAVICGFFLFFFPSVFSLFAAVALQVAG